MYYKTQEEHDRAKGTVVAIYTHDGHIVANIEYKQGEIMCKKKGLVSSTVFAIVFADSKELAPRRLLIDLGADSQMIPWKKRSIKIKKRPQKNL